MEGANPVATLRAVLYGDAPLDQWPDEDDLRDTSDIWARFVAARQAARCSDLQSATTIWRNIAATPGLESRQYLQAWTFLRRVGEQPDPDEAKHVLGVAIEMPMQQSHDLLAAYEDGSRRYVNYTGAVLVMDDRTIQRVRSAIDAWLDIGRSLVHAIGP